MLRIVTALILLSVLWPITEMGAAWAFHLLVAVTVALGTWECYRLLEARGARPTKILGLAAGVALVWAAAGQQPAFDAALPLVAVTIAAPAVALLRRPDPASMLDTTAGTLLPVLLIALGLSYLARIRAVPGEDGKDLVYLLFVCMILGDTAAFYVGARIGRTRLAPRVSPGKSWEGVLGGMAASVAGGLLAHFWFFPGLPLLDAVILGIVLGVAGILGDLAESVLKRAARVKDSSSLLPGHGGVLDRADSLLFSAPVLYYYYRFVGFVGSVP
jgi:phosphatidate cytidylyltransferase